MKNEYIKLQEAVEPLQKENERLKLELRKRNLEITSLRTAISTSTQNGAQSNNQPIKTHLYSHSTFIRDLSIGDPVDIQINENTWTSAVIRGTQDAKLIIELEVNESGETQHFLIERRSDMLAPYQTRSIGILSIPNDAGEHILSLEAQALLEEYREKMEGMKEQNQRCLRVLVASCGSLPLAERIMTLFDSCYQLQRVISGWKEAQATQYREELVKRQSEEGSVDMSGFFPSVPSSSDLTSASEQINSLADFLSSLRSDLPQSSQYWVNLGTAVVGSYKAVIDQCIGALKTKEGEREEERVKTFLSHKYICIETQKNGDSLFASVGLCEALHENLSAFQPSEVLEQIQNPAVHTDLAKHVRQLAVRHLGKHLDRFGPLIDERQREALSLSPPPPPSSSSSSSLSPASNLSLNEKVRAKLRSDLLSTFGGEREAQEKIGTTEARDLYLQLLSQSGVPGSHMEIHILNDVFQCPITVIPATVNDSDSIDPLLFGTQHVQATFYLLYSPSKDHYDLLIPRSLVGLEEKEEEGEEQDRVENGGVRERESERERQTGRQHNVANGSPSLSPSSNNTVSQAQQRERERSSPGDRSSHPPQTPERGREREEEGGSDDEWHDDLPPEASPTLPPHGTVSSLRIQVPTSSSSAVTSAANVERERENERGSERKSVEEREREEEDETYQQGLRRLSLSSSRNRDDIDHTPPPVAYREEVVEDERFAFDPEEFGGPDYGSPSRRDDGDRERESRERRRRRHDSERDSERPSLSHMRSISPTRAPALVKERSRYARRSYDSDEDDLDSPVLRDEEVTREVRMESADTVPEAHMSPVRLVPDSVLTSLTQARSPLVSVLSNDSSDGKEAYSVTWASLDSPNIGASHERSRSNDSSTTLNRGSPILSPPKLQQLSPHASGVHPSRVSPGSVSLPSPADPSSSSPERGPPGLPRPERASSFPSSSAAASTTSSSSTSSSLSRTVKIREKEKRVDSSLSLSPNAEHNITLYVLWKGKQRISFVYPRTEPFLSFMQRFATQTKCRLARLKFHTEDQREVRRESTAESLSLSDGDTILASISQF